MEIERGHGWLALAYLWVAWPGSGPRQLGSSPCAACPPSARPSWVSPACRPSLSPPAPTIQPFPEFGPAVVRASPSQSSSSRGLGGGLIEYLASGASARIAPALASPPAPIVNVAPAPVYAAQNPPSQQVAALVPATLTSVEIGPSEEFQRQEVAYDGPERAGTIVIDTPRKFLFLVEPGRRAIRYGIGVGRPGFEWSGVKPISRKAEWPDWTPPPEMLLRRPDLPASHGRRARQPARRPRAVSGLVDVPDPRHQRALDDRAERLLGLHPDDERGRNRPL